MKKHGTTTLLLVLTLLFYQPLIGQKISGTLTFDGMPMAGISIIKTGTANGAVSDQDGNFTIAAFPGDTLQVYSGYVPFTLIAKPQLTIDLAEWPYDISETVRKGKAFVKIPFPEKGGAVSRIRQERFNQGNVYDPLSLLQGQVPGGIITRPGGDPLFSYRMRIRGLHSAIFAVDNPSHLGFGYPIDLTQPLYVVDGFPDAGLQAVDPADIASFTILRDAASAAAYGVRGANGVVLIETKHGKPGRLRVQYETALALESPANLPDVFSADEWVRLRNDPNSKLYNPDLVLDARTNWMEEITRSVFNSAHHLSFSGGDGNSNYRFALHYRNQDGIARNSGFDQYSSQFRGNHRFWKDRLTLGGSFSYLRRDLQDVNPAVFDMAAAYNPTAPVFDNTSNQYGGYFQQELFYNYNPVAMIEQTQLGGEEQIATTSLNLSVEPLPGLVFSGKYGFQWQDNFYTTRYDKDAFFSQIEYGLFPPLLSYQPISFEGGVASSRDEQRNHHFFLGQASYSKDWNQHSLSFSAGYNFQRFDLETTVLQGLNYPDNDFIVEDLGTPASTAEYEMSGSRRYRDDLIAFYGALQYDFDETFFLSANLRREGASRFGPDNKWANFQAATAAVALNRMFNWQRFQNLKLRVGYGEAGQLPPKVYSAWALIRPTVPFYYNGEYRLAYEIRQQPNRSIGPERRREWNLGMDVALQNQRMGGSLDLFWSKSEDLVYDYAAPIAYSYPYDWRLPAQANFGKLSNRGLELTLWAKPVEKERFSWTSTFQLTRVRTTMEGLTNPVGEDLLPRYSGLLGAPGCCSARPQRQEEGRTLGEFYLPVFERVIEGVPQYADLDGDGFAPGQDDSKVVGNGQPDWLFGWQNRLQFGRFHFGFLLRGVLGHQMINSFDASLGVASQLFYRNGLREALEGERAAITDFIQLSSFHVQDASFLRMEYLSLGYDLKVGKLDPLRLTLTAQNLFTITGYNGLDPELRTQQLTDPLTQGMDGPLFLGEVQRDAYYPVRSLVLGLQVGF